MIPIVRPVARPLVAAIAVMLAASACAGRRPAPASVPAPAPVSPTVPVPSSDSVPPPVTALEASGQDGYATYVARSFHGRTSASGQRFDERQMVAAHRTLPFGSIVRVTNVRNGRTVTVRIVDRGPYGKNYREGTIIDLSRAAANQLRMVRDGQIPARLQVLELGEAK
jgi:rare lipoprotein A